MNTEKSDQLKNLLKNGKLLYVIVLDDASVEVKGIDNEQNTHLINYSTAEWMQMFG